MPQEAPRRSQDADSYVFSRAGEAPGRRFTCVFACRRGPRRTQEADPYVFLRVFLESGSGPRMVQETDSYVFYRVFLACGPHHTCFYVSAVVSRRAGAVPASFDVPVISCMLVAFWQDHT